jgi:CRP-like cAMP-binding protein
MYHRSSINGVDLTRFNSRSSHAALEAAQKAPQVLLKQNFNVTLPRMLQRRNAVSAESSRPGELGDANYVVQSYPKTQMQRARIQDILSGIALFQGVSESVMKDLVGGFFEMKYNDGDKIIVQGDVIAERFFLLESGLCDIFVKKGNADPIKVHTVLPGGFFGELALLYNAPRAATVVSVGESKLWALDRGTFKSCMARASKSDKPAMSAISVAASSKPPPASMTSRSSIDLVNDQMQKVSDPKSETSDSVIPPWNQIIKAKITGGDAQFADTFSQFLLQFRYP